VDGSRAAFVCQWSRFVRIMPAASTSVFDLVRALARSSIAGDMVLAADHKATEHVGEDCPLVFCQRAHGYGLTRINYC